MFLPIMSQPGQTMAILQARQTSDEKDIQETKFNSIDHLRAALSRFCINLRGKLSPAGQSRKIIFISLSTFTFTFESCPFQVLHKFMQKVVTGRPEPGRKNSFHFHFSRLGINFCGKLSRLEQPTASETILNDSRKTELRLLGILKTE